MGTKRDGKQYIVLGGLERLVPPKVLVADGGSGINPNAPSGRIV